MTRFGFTRPTRPRSTSTSVRFVPVGGFTELPDIEAAPGSITSGQNVWIRRGRLEPRWRLEQAADNILSDLPAGAFDYDDVGGARFPIVTSQGTVAFLDNDSYVSLQYVSGTSNLPPTSGQNDQYFGTSVYLPRRDLNIGVFTNGVDPLFAWGGPSDNTGFSTLTQGPIAKDVTLFANRVVAWNIRELSSSSRVVNRAQWPVGGDPEDWLGIGSGFEDLVDMHGQGTRIFSTEEEMILMSTEEIWRGRLIGGDFIFRFSPLNREVGVPFRKAAIQTKLGLFWLGSDSNIYHLQGARLDTIGDDIQRTLRDTIDNEKAAFFGFNEELQQLTFYYSITPTGQPTRAFTWHRKDRAKWTPQAFSDPVAQSFQLNIPSSATTWGGLLGVLSAQSQTYNDLLGQSTTPDEALLTSVGTTAFFSDSAGSDLGATVLSQAVFGGLFGADADNIKFSDRLRIDARADSASSLTVSVSGNLGGSYQAAQEFAISVQSATTQSSLRLGVPGLYHAVKVESDEGRWQVVTVKLDASLLGEA
ncbi:hypothetical protein LCGC14_0967070 [marine sediment metagenome]|uniref:Uncharacterized protein n=1 Tax=marine sediment metagenome TaxID=412755 RepID=A0A0F9RJC1_9ZZZZ